MVRWVTSLSLSFMLLASVWGSVLTAASCPHAKADHACCHAHATHHPASHAGMEEMQMNDSRGGAMAGRESDGEALGQPVGLCEYCMGRSQLPAHPAALQETGQSKRGADVEPTLPPAELGPDAAAFTHSIPAREHAPPRATNSARHVLISVFRI